MSNKNKRLVLNIVYAIACVGVIACAIRAFFNSISFIAFKDSATKVGVTVYITSASFSCLITIIATLAFISTIKHVQKKSNKLSALHKFTLLFSISILLVMSIICAFAIFSSYSVAQLQTTIIPFTHEICYELLTNLLIIFALDLYNSKKNKSNVNENEDSTD